MKTVERLKEIVERNKFKLMGVVASTPVIVAASSVTALASESSDTVSNLTTGMNGFIGLVSSMMNTILGSPTLSIAFAAAFAVPVIKLIKRTIKMGR